MVRTLALAAVVTLTLTCGAQTPAPANADDAPSILRRAVAAHGGAELINKYPAAKIKSKGCMVVPLYPQPADFTSLVTYQMPDRFKQVLTISLAGVSRCVTHVIEGDKIRQYADGQEVPMTEAEAARFRHAMYVQNLLRLTPLLDAKIYRFGLVDDAMVCDRPARGVRISSEKRKEVTLYFDKGTGLLVRAVRSATDMLGKEAIMEEIFMNYKDVRGVLYPSKTLVLLNGKKSVESEVVEFLPLERFDASEFAGP